jgi:hypothetical protein
MEPNTLKELFDKYILIWIWSIFIGINSALSYNIFNLYNPSRWQVLNIIIIPIYVLAVLTALGSWIYLFRFLQIKILPFLLSKYNDPFFNISDPKAEAKRDLYSYKLLKSSFFFIIFAISFRFLIPLCEMIFGIIYK